MATITAPQNVDKGWAAERDLIVAALSAGARDEVAISVDMPFAQDEWIVRVDYPGVRTHTIHCNTSVAQLVGAEDFDAGLTPEGVAAHIASKLHPHLCSGSEVTPETLERARQEQRAVDEQARAVALQMETAIAAELAEIAVAAELAKAESGGA